MLDGIHAKRATQGSSGKTAPLAGSSQANGRIATLPEPTTKQLQLLHLLKQSRITGEMLIKAHEPVITIGGSLFGRRGDFALVTGQAKAGKTTVLAYIMGTSLLDQLPHNQDTCGVVSTPALGKDIIYLDTEGSHQDTYDFVKNVNRIAGVHQTPANFFAYNLRECTREECRERLELLSMLHPSPHLLIIDGGADIVDIMDSEKASEWVRWVMRTASQLYTCIVIVLHENPKQPGQVLAKLRGHLGSELERKTSAAVTVEKDKESGDHFIRPRLLRKSADFTAITFRWDKETGLPISRAMTAEEREDALKGTLIKKRELVALRDACFGEYAQLTAKELREKIIARLPYDHARSRDASRNQANRKIDTLLRESLILAGEDGEKDAYLLPTNGKQLPVEYDPDDTKMDG